MKIIFLDMDGFLNYEGCMGLLYKSFSLSETFCFVSDQRLELLKEIVTVTDAKLVLTSPWRLGWYHQEAGARTCDCELFESLVDKLSAHGLELFDKTECTGTHRGDEITLWLSKWKGEKIESYIILDHLEPQYFHRMKCHLVRTVCNKGGLTPRLAARAIRILNRERRD